MQVLLLSSGRPAYFGPASGIAFHFKLLGVSFPSNASVSEAAMNVINAEFNPDPTQVETILNAWAERPPMPTPERLELVHPPARSGFVATLTTLAKRHAKVSVADPNVYIARIVTFIISSLIVSTGDANSTRRTSRQC